MDSERVTPLGKLDFRKDDRPFGIKHDDRRFHMALIGRTGTGKSTMMTSMIESDANGPEGLALLDPHGDLAETALSLVPTWRQQSTVFFDPANPDSIETFNPLEVPSPDQRHLVVADLIVIFNRIWERSWGPRLEYILRNVLMALTEKPGHTLCRCAAASQ